MNRPPTHDPAVDSPTPAANKPASGWRRARLLLPALLCLSGACAPAPKTWRAEAQLMILSPAPPVSGDPLGVGPSGADESMETQITLLQSREMARRTAAEMKNTALRMNDSNYTENLTPDDIQKSVKATNPPGTHLLVVTAEENSPGQAQSLANATTQAFVAYKKDLAARDMTDTQRKLEREAARAAQGLDMAERQEQLSRQVPAPFGAARLAENTEIAKELYRRLQTSLAAVRLQRDLVSGDVAITEYAEMPQAPS